MAIEGLSHTEVSGLTGGYGDTLPQSSPPSTQHSTLRKSFFPLKTPYENRDNEHWLWGHMPGFRFWQLPVGQGYTASF